MIEKNKIVALIPARGGSKGIKNKNIIDLCGKPLISYTIQAALESKYIDKVIVSTDSQEIADVAIKYGAEVPFLRPGELASDTSKTIDAVMHAVGELEKRKEEYADLKLEKSNGCKWLWSLSGHKSQRKIQKDQNHFQSKDNKTYREKTESQKDVLF